MDIPNFSDLTEHINLEGDKIKIDEILNKPIIVTGSYLSDSKFKNKGSGVCTKIQFYFADDKTETKRVVFSGSSVIYDQIVEMQNKFSDDKKFLNDCKNKIEQFLKMELDLEFSKAQIFNVKQGVDFCGYRHFGKYVLIRKTTVKRMKRRINNLKQGTNYDKMLGQIASANGIIKHSNGYNLFKTLGLQEKKNRIMEERRLSYG